MSNINSAKATLITGVIGEDVHVTGIRILEHALKNSGFNVHSLGIHNTQEDFIKAAVDTGADAILISSLCGHARLLVDDIRQKCTQKGLENILLYIGGQLVIHAEEWKKTERTFKKIGFNRVYQPFILPEPVIADLKGDLKIE
ncbi:MAG: methylaspartate mutase subunit S [Candidatus Aminicenantes bacterium]|nr:methylaspartate mutase subunit S [Candidatus Aminicenantes bacterium]